jgi:hypothetical protein
VVALQPPRQLAPERGAAIRIGDRLVADPEGHRELFRADVAKLRGAQPLSGVVAVVAQPDRPHQRAAAKRALAVDQMRALVARLVVDGAEEERRVGVGDVAEVGRVVTGEELADAVDYAYHQTVVSTPSSSSTGVV